MANRLFQAFIDTAKTIAGYPITVANAVFMRDGSTLDEFSENIPHREDDEDTNIEVPNIDADMLNGHPADYYSKQSDLSALNTSVTQVNNKIGNTDVSKWGNSLTGAIKAACDKSDANETAIADVNSNLNNLNGRFVGGTVNANQTIQITGVSDSWSKNYVLFTGRSGSMGSMYYRDFEGITPIIGNPDINVYLDAGYLYIRNNGGVTIQYGIIKIQ